MFLASRKKRDAALVSHKAPHLWNQSLLRLSSSFHCHRTDSNTVLLKSSLFSSPILHTTDIETFSRNPVRVSTWLLHLYSFCELSVWVCTWLKVFVLCSCVRMQLSFHLSHKLRTDTLVRPSSRFDCCLCVSVCVCRRHLSSAFNWQWTAERRNVFLCRTKIVDLVPHFLEWSHAEELALRGQCEESEITVTKNSSYPHAGGAVSMKARL